MDLKTKIEEHMSKYNNGNFDFYKWANEPFNGALPVWVIEEIIRTLECDREDALLALKEIKSNYKEVN